MECSINEAIAELKSESLTGLEMSYFFTKTSIHKLPPF